MIRRPPRSTLFPYTRSSDLFWWRTTPMTKRSRCALSRSTTSRTTSWSPTTRSEEHTSELQSLAYLVCRLLLEKKRIRASRVDRDVVLAVEEVRQVRLRGPRE